MVWDVFTVSLYGSHEKCKLVRAVRAMTNTRTELHLSLISFDLGLIYVFVDGALYETRH
jgi:hypothetical protein